MVQIFLYLSVFLHFPHLYPNVTHIYAIFPASVFLNRTIPVIRPLARGSMLSITTAHPTLHPTWQVTTPAPARPPPPPHTPSRSHPLASPARPSQKTLRVRVKPQAAGLLCVTWISGVWSCYVSFLNKQAAAKPPCFHWLEVAPDKRAWSVPKILVCPKPYAQYE